LFGLSLTLSTNAFAKELAPTSMKSTQDLQKAIESLKCPADKYQSQQNPSAPPISGCQQCMGKLRGTFGEVDSAVAGGVTKDRSLSAAGSTATKAISTASNGKQKNTQNSAENTQNTGAATQADRASNAKQVAAAFEKCKSDVQSSCQESQLIGDDKKGASDAKQACEEGAKGANEVAAEKAGSGMDMGQLGQMAQQLAQGLGSMMQQKPKSEDKSAPSMDPSSSGLSTTPIESALATPAESTMGNSTPDGQLQNAQDAKFEGLDAAKVAQIGGASLGEAGKNGTAVNTGAGGGPNAASSTPYDSGGAGSTGGGTGTIGSDPRGGSAAGTSMAGGSAGGASGGGSGNSSGASSYDPDAAAAKAAAGGESSNGAYEIASGGGGGSKFLGLRSKSADLSELDGALGADGSAMNAELAALDAEHEGGRGLASEEGAQNADIHADGSSLFSVVRSKLVEIKKRGNI